MATKIQLSKSQSVTLPAQLCEQLRKQIATGELAAGERLPSSRELAEQLGIARATIIESYRQLSAEGYIVGKDGSGTYVSETLPQAELQRQQPRPDRAERNLSNLSGFAKRVLQRDNAHPQTAPLQLSFCPWRPSLAEVPATQLANSLARLIKLGGANVLDFPVDEAGLPQLRQAIATYIKRYRAIDCSAEQIVVFAGLQQALDVAARVHLERGDTAAVENPGYPGVRQLFECEGATVVGVEVDDVGMQVAQLLDADECIRLVHVTASHQYPTGVSLALPRRMQLLSWARRTGAVVIEDEHDSEFQHGEHPISALKALDHHGQVIYIGTLAKVVFPGIGLAYAVLPQQLVKVYARVRTLSADQPTALIQACVADFIHSGLLARHRRKMSVLYTQRRDVLVQSLEKAFRKSVSISGAEAGLHLLARFETDMSATEITEQAARIGVELFSSDSCYMNETPGKPEFIMGYGDLETKQIKEAVRRIATIIR